MNIATLIRPEDTLIRNDFGHYVVLTPDGAAFNSFMTADLRNMCPAFGMLFTSTWRHATPEEQAAWLKKPAEPQILSFDSPPVAPRPTLKVIRSTT